MILSPKFKIKGLIFCSEKKLNSLNFRKYMFQSKIGKIKDQIRNKLVINKKENYGKWWQEQGDEFYD